MSIRKLFPSGGLEVTAIVGGYLVRRVYFGYSRAEAAARFRREIKKGGAS